MDTGNLILILAVGGIGIYVLQQSQKRSAAEELRLAEVQLQREKNIAKATKRSPWESLGGLVGEGYGWVKSWGQ